MIVRIYSFMMKKPKNSQTRLLRFIFNIFICATTNGFFHTKLFIFAQ